MTGMRQGSGGCPTPQFRARLKGGREASYEPHDHQKHNGSECDPSGHCTRSGLRNERQPDSAQQIESFAGQQCYLCSTGCLSKFRSEPSLYVGEHPKLPEVEAEAVGDTGVYTCPTHPQIVRSEPGTCPICGMALEPRDVAMDDKENAELVDMRRRLWVPLRKPSSEQIQCFMIFTKCPISRLFITSRRPENGSTMNFATEP
jgi:YHS domain-containing protein